MSALLRSSLYRGSCARSLLVAPARRAAEFAGRSQSRSAPICSSVAVVGPLTPYRDVVWLGRLEEDASQLAAVHVLQQLAETPAGEGADGLAGVYLWGSVGSGKSMLMDLFAGATDQTCLRLHFHELMVDVHTQLHAIHAARPKRVVYTKEGLPVYRYGDVGGAEDEAADAEEATASKRVVEGGGEADSDEAAEPRNASASAHAPSEMPPISRVIEALASRGAYLCLDEMQVRRGRHLVRYRTMPRHNSAMT